MILFYYHMMEVDIEFLIIGLGHLNLGMLVSLSRPAILLVSCFSDALVCWQCPIDPA